MRCVKFLLFFFIQFSFLYAQREWFPSQMNIQPFTANFLEPKAGFAYLLDKSELRLDVGTSADIYQYCYDNTILSFGSDLFTYTRLRGEKDFHFPVDAVDYLFGINIGYKVSKENKEYGIRFRLSHISAHFVDGHFNPAINGWHNGINPRVYSREFLEFFPFYRIDGFRAYAGLTYLFHVKPEVIGKGIYQTGFDYFITSLTKTFLPFIAYDFKLSEINKFYGNNILSAGIKFGDFKNKGLSIFVSYFSGKSIHGEYFDVNEKYFTLGVNMDL